MIKKIRHLKFPIEQNLAASTQFGWHAWYGYGTAMLQYDTITRMSVFPDYVPLGEEARFPIFQGKRPYPGDSRAFLSDQNHE